MATKQRPFTQARPQFDLAAIEDGLDDPLGIRLEADLLGQNIRGARGDHRNRDFAAQTPFATSLIVPSPPATAMTSILPPPSSGSLGGRRPTEPLGISLGLGLPKDDLDAAFAQQSHDFFGQTPAASAGCGI